MTITSKFNATTLEINNIDDLFITLYFLDLYDIFNKKAFSTNIVAPKEIQNMCNIICDSFKQDHLQIEDANITEHKSLENVNSKDVLLGFSAGLDSVFQAIWLKEHGYIVHLLFARNINTYENGQSWKYAKIIADKLNLDLIDINVKKKRNIEYSQAWPENPIKNQLILSVMVDICLNKSWKYISLGDDFDLSIDKAISGINTTDAKEVTYAYLDCIKTYVKGLEFLQIEKGNDKGKRLQKLFEYNLQDDYYSCVQAGRFNKSIRKRIQNKFGVQLLGNNCGCCRKCCMHNLIMHYTKMKQFPEKFIKHCWEKMYSTGCNADYEFFKPELSLETRISNLFSY